MKLLFNFRSSITLILVLLLKIALDSALSIEIIWLFNNFEPYKIYAEDVLIYILIITCIIYVCMEMLQWWFKFEKMNRKYEFKD